MKCALLFAASALALTASAVTMTAGSTDSHAQKVNIKLSYWLPPTMPLTKGYQAWSDSIRHASNGNVTTSLFPSSQLGSERDHYDMVKRGVAGFSLINPGYKPGRFPILGASDLPFTVTDSLAAARALTIWYKKYAAMEMPDQIVCHVFTHDRASFHTSKKQIRVPADVKGLIIRSVNRTMSRFVTALRGNPVQVPIIEAKDTQAKGITDGIILTFGGLTGTFKFKDVVKYTLDMPLYVSTFTHGINYRLYNGLNTKYRRVIDDHCTPEWSAKVYRPWYDKDQKDQADGRKLKDHIFTKVSPAEVKLWRDAARPVVAAWKTSVKKIGLNPDTVLKEMRDELNKVNALF